MKVIKNSFENDKKHYAGLYIVCVCVCVFEFMFMHFVGKSQPNHSGVRILKSYKRKRERQKLKRDEINKPMK